jgi:hypothetical protein
MNRVQNTWLKFSALSDSIASEKIDNYQVYRLINGAYNGWDKVGVYQRNLGNFDQYTTFEYTSTDRSRVNCHMFSQNKPENMLLHFRAAQGGTVVVDGKEMKKIDTKTDHTRGACGYPHIKNEIYVLSYLIDDFLIHYGNSCFIPSL